MIVAEALDVDKVKKFFEQCQPKQGKLLKREFEKLISLLSDNENSTSNETKMTNIDNDKNNDNKNDSNEEEDDDFEEMSVEEVFEELCNDKKMIPFKTLASW